MESQLKCPWTVVYDILWRQVFILYVGATLGTAPVAFQIVGIWDVDVRLLGGSLENENGKF